MRFNFVSETSDGMGFAMRLQSEGNPVRMWIRDQHAKEVGDGLVTKVGDVEDLLNGASKDEDVFIFDTSGNGIIADSLREQGYAVMGGSVAADRLERDRAFGTGAMEQAGILVPKTKTFHDFASAKKYAKGRKERMVFKPSKALGELFCSHVSYDQEDMLDYLDNVEAENGLANPEFDLQDFEEGVALSTEVWFDGENFLPLFNHTLERKELMDGNLGPSGGCTGNIVWACGECPVCEEARKIESFLRDNRFVGMLDLNAIISERGVFGLEWTPRFGYDASPTLFWGLLDGDLGRFFADVARRSHTSESPQLVPDIYASAVRLTIPPWPSERFQAESNMPLLKLPKSMDKDVYFYNVKAKNDDPSKIVSAGAWGILALFIDKAETVKSAFKTPYKQAKDIHVPNKQYRLDLVDQFDEDLAKLKDILG